MSEYDSGWIEVVSPNCFAKFIFEDGQIEVLVNFAVDFAYVTMTLGCHTTPDYDGTTAVFDSLLEVTVLERLSISNPEPTTPVRSKTVNCGLIRKYDTTPVLNSPVLVNLGECQASFDVFW